MKDVRDLKDLTIHDVQPWVAELVEEGYRRGSGHNISMNRLVTSYLWARHFLSLFLSSLSRLSPCPSPEPEPHKHRAPHVPYLQLSRYPSQRGSLSRPGMAKLVEEGFARGSGDNMAINLTIKSLRCVWCLVCG